MSSEQMETVDLAALSEWTWERFERFAVGVLADAYSGTGLKIKPTRFQADGGRDGEAIYIFKPDRDASPAADDLAIVLRLWVEVKQARTGKVDLNRIGGHVILASNEGANKLVLVTNSEFAERVVVEMQRFCCNSRLSCAFIDGKRLLEMHRSAGAEALPDPEEAAPADAPRSDANSGSAVGPTVSVRLSVDAFAGEQHLSGAPLLVEVGEPLFVIVDVEVGEQPIPRSVSYEVEAPDGWSGPLQPIWSSFNPPLLAGERCRSVYVLYPGSGAMLDAGDLRVVVRGPGPAPGSIDTRGTAEVRSLALVQVDLPSSRPRTDALLRRVAGWLQEGGVELVGIWAVGGTGKSHLLRKLRRRWLSAGPLEIMLDGGVHPDVERIFRRLVEAALCLPPTEQAGQSEALLRDLLGQSGLSTSASERMAHTLVSCLTEGTLAAAPHELADTLAAVLALVSTDRRLVVAVEDLHKIMPSGLQLLLETFRLLRHGARGKILLAVTSRPMSTIRGEATHGSMLDPLEAMFDLLDVGLTDLESPSHTDAVFLLERSILGMERHLAHQIVDQVGTLPFALKEAVTWLAQQGILVRVSQPDVVWEIRDRKEFRSRIASERLTIATHRRLIDLQRGLDARFGWLGDFLATGAILGRRFPTDLALEVCGAASASLEPALESYLFRWDVLRTFRRDSRLVSEFNHDLIRSAVLDGIAPGRLQRLSDQVLETAADRIAPLTLARLACHAGHLTRCAEIASRIGLQATEESRHWDALQAALIEIAAVDPDCFGDLLESPDLVNLVMMDDGLRRLRGAPSEVYRHDRRQRVYALIFKCLSSLSRMGVGRRHGFEPLLTEAAMLAEEMDDDAGRGRLEYFLGFAEFEQDNFEAAAQHHREAERLYQYAGLVGPDRIDNLNRLFLCERQVGSLDAAEQILLQTEALLGDDLTPDRIALLLNYRGYAKLYVDPTRIPPLWREAYECAHVAGLRRYAIEPLISCGYIAFLLEDPEQAYSDFARAEAELEAMDLEAQRVRLYLDRGVLNLASGKLGDARMDLEEACRIGVKYNIQRRLWRVEANLATLFEALGDTGKVLAFDTRSMAGWRSRAEREAALGAEAPWLHQRHVLPAINIALRAQAGSQNHEQLLAWLPNSVRIAIEELASQAKKSDRSKMPGALGFHIKLVRGHPRALVTE